jgi:hypothetical protein
MLDIKNILNNAIRAEDASRTMDHVASGKLSASMLGMPTQWQVLKYLGVPKKLNDEYELLKFRRGRDVEDFVTSTVSASLNCQQQVECRYRDCVGYLDLLVGDDAVEIKSTNSMAFKHIKKEGNAKKAHALQAAFYGVALGLDNFSVCYVNADSYDSMCFEYQTNKFKGEIDGIIDRFDNCVAAKEIPEFVAMEHWMKLPMYMNYPYYENLSKLALAEFAKELYSRKLGE